MADVKKIEHKALEILEEKTDIYFFQDLADELGYSRQWLYELGVDKIDTIRNALLKNKQTWKRNLRNKWYLSENPTVQVVLYKLLAEEEELKKLNNSRVELTGADGTPLPPPIINIVPVNGNNDTDSK